MFEFGGMVFCSVLSAGFAGLATSSIFTGLAVLFGLLALVIGFLKIEAALDLG